ncbi:putative aldehyde dehydrogenase (NAD(P)(+)) [Helianthus annuus]|nr:putative aldehyde dehydrogenase (NAD(P)(+)) [Helianthus annuus]
MAQIHTNGNSISSLTTPKIHFTKLFINGQFVDSVSGKTFETIDPRTEEKIADIAEGDKDDVDLAVEAARAAFDHGPWPRMSGSERGRIMMKFVDLVEQHLDEIAALDALDVGKVLSQGKAREVPFGISVLRYYAGAADKIYGKTLKLSNQPSSRPFRLYIAGVPDGVINVVTGYGTTAGAAISSHMDIDCVSFTGSSEVGRLIMQAAATSNLKSVSLELGGKSPLIVFDDVDVDSAVNLALMGGFANKGEFCVCSSRIFVQEGIYDEFVTKIARNSKGLTVGDPFEPSTVQGPQADKAQYEKVLSYIEHGKRQGATLLTGGNPCREKGYYIEPTIFTDVKDDMLIATDEIFGPVMCVIKFKTIEEAIARANSTRYGLAAGIVTKDLNIANTVSRSIRAGIVWINCYLAFDADCPYGGYKMSGFGREFGMEALYKYLQVKSVVTPVHNSPWL